MTAARALARRCLRFVVTIVAAATMLVTLAHSPTAPEEQPTGRGETLETAPAALGPPPEPAETWSIKNVSPGILNASVCVLVILGCVALRRRQVGGDDRPLDAMLTSRRRRRQHVTARRFGYRTRLSPEMLSVSRT